MPLTKWLKAFPAMSSLQPFEAALLDLTVGAATYASVLGKVDALRKTLQEVRRCAGWYVCVFLGGCRPWWFGGGGWVQQVPGRAWHGREALEGCSLLAAAGAVRPSPAGVRDPDHAYPLCQLCMGRLARLGQT